MSGEAAKPDGPRDPPAEAEPLLSVQNLEKHFPVNSGVLGSLRFDPSSGVVPFRLDESSVKAVDGVSFELRPGETLGVVGESGCGKSTLARTVLGLEAPTGGTVEFEGRATDSFDADAMQQFRKNAQIVFQDPQSSLNPRRTIGSIVADPLEAAGWSQTRRRERVLELLEQVGLDRDHYGRYPHEFSGGQRQRVNLARALSINPDLVVADEPVSGLDMSVQAQILELMQELQAEYGLTYLFITHDLSVIRNVADRVAVMYLGEFVEIGSTERLFTEPHHPYTRALLKAVPNPNPDGSPVEPTLEGDVPSPSDPPSGCPFHTRCPEQIVPDGFTQETYTSFEAFRTDVETRTLDADDGPDAVRRRYFDDDDIPGGARRAVRESVEHAARDEWDDALDALAEFRSVCATTNPRLDEAAGDGHRSACHLGVEERESFTW